MSRALTGGACSVMTRMICGGGAGACGGLLFG